MIKGNNDGIAVDGDNSNNGVQIGTNINSDTQNSYGLSQNISVESQEQLDEQTSNHLKDMPILNVDDGVKFALNPDCLDNLILNNAERIITFIPHGGRTFGIKNGADIIGVTPSVLLSGDILLVEPCMPPSNGNLVLICLEYGTNKQRGMIARFIIDPISNQRLIKHDDGEPVSIPLNSVICGVIIKVERNLVEATLIKSKIDPKWDILSTLELGHGEI